MERNDRDRHDSFGKRTDQPGVTGLISFGYTGKYHDSYTNSTYHWNRWYDPQLGRWLSEDPIGFAGVDTNLGRYVGNDSTGSLDPEGLARIKFQQTWLDIAKIELEKLVRDKVITREEAKLREFVIDNTVNTPFEFDVAQNSVRNTAYWTDMVNVKGWYTTKFGVSPAEAIKDLWSSGLPCKTGCRKAIDLIFLKSEIDFIENKYTDPRVLKIAIARFDRIVSDGQAKPVRPPIVDNFVKKIERPGGFKLEDMKPGDNVHFENPKHLRVGDGSEGLNTIYVGDGWFIGYDGRVFDGINQVQQYLEGQYHGGDEKLFKPTTINSPRLVPDKR